MKVEIVNLCPTIVSESSDDKKILQKYLEALLFSFAEQVYFHRINRETAFYMLHEFYIHFPSKFQEKDDEYFVLQIEIILNIIYGFSDN